MKLQVSNTISPFYQTQFSSHECRLSRNLESYFASPLSNYLWTKVFIHKNLWTFLVQCLNHFTSFVRSPLNGFINQSAVVPPYLLIQYPRFTAARKKGKLKK
jgi:hypothetical protein